MIRYKELEQFYHDNFIDLKNNFSQIEERILLVIEHLNKEMIENQTVIFNLQ